MAQEELLVNFSIGPEPLSLNATAYHGGRWKDRVKAKKVATWRQKRLPATEKASQPSTSEGNNAPEDQAIEARLEDTPRPSKRVRVDGGVPSSVEPKTRIGAGAAKYNASGANSHPGQVISSLFTYNPAPTTALDPRDSAVAGKDIAPSNAPHSSEVSTFASLGLLPKLIDLLAIKLDIKTPTAIQKEAVPRLLATNSDIFMQAETGSGKTIAYLLPILQRILQSAGSLLEGSDQEKTQKLQRGSGLFAIVVAPTRELCHQIYGVADSIFRCSSRLVVGEVTGGEKKKSEKARLRKGVNVLIATPGRLLDHLTHTQALNSKEVRWLVLDEGDRLVDLGFEEQIKKIIGLLNLSQKAGNREESVQVSLPARRVNILCSATMRVDVDRLGEISLKNAVRVHAKASPQDMPSGTALEKESRTEVPESAPSQLRQSYMVVAAKLRLITLTAVLKQRFTLPRKGQKAIVFLSCTDSVDFHYDIFTRDTSRPVITKAKAPESRDGKTLPERPLKVLNTHSLAVDLTSEDCQVSLYKLHGSLPQQLRKATLASFSSTQDPAVLLCTDVASRGIDVVGVDLVIEYDPPFSKTEHLHRIGRTARAGRDGQSLIFLLPGSEEEYISVLRDSCSEEHRDLIRLDADDYLGKAFSSKVKEANKGAYWKEAATNWQLDVEKWALQSPARTDNARRAYKSHIRAYATHVAAERHIFNMKSLHLGHLSKSFALRDAPGSIPVGKTGPISKRRTTSTGKRRREADSNGTKTTNSVTPSRVSGSRIQSDGASKMKVKAKQQASAAAEFNID